MEIARDRRLEPIVPSHLVRRDVFKPEVRVYFKLWVLAFIFVVGGGLFGFVYGFLTV